MKLIVFISSAIALTLSAAVPLLHLSPRRPQQEVSGETSSSTFSTTNPSTISSDATTSPATSTVPAATSTSNAPATSAVIDCPCAMHSSASTPTFTTTTTTSTIHFTGSSTKAPNMNGYINYWSPGRHRAHIDTLNNSWGIASSAQLARVRFTQFCRLNSRTKHTCRSIEAHVLDCAHPYTADGEGPNDCHADYSRNLLAKTVGHEPCKAMNRADALTQKVCAGWIIEARRCTRGVTDNGDAEGEECGRHHALYLLKKFADLIGMRQNTAVGV